MTFLCHVLLKIRKVQPSADCGLGNPGSRITGTLKRKVEFTEVFDL